MKLPDSDAAVLTAASAQTIFPFTPLIHIQTYLPDVLDAARAAQVNRTLLGLALATIRAETESFVPATEQESRFNTTVGGVPFDLYDFRRELGNHGPPDGYRYRGRGYVQLTGRYNYECFGKVIGQDLVGSPEQAAQSVTAARILFAFLNAKRDQLLHYAARGDLASARRVVNGGSHGLDRFCDAYRRANSVLSNCESPAA